MKVVMTGISGLGKDDILAKIREIKGTDSSDRYISDPDVTFNSRGSVDLTFDLEHEMCMQNIFITFKGGGKNEA